MDAPLDHDDADSLRAALFVFEEFDFDFAFLFDENASNQTPPARPTRRRATSTPLPVTPDPYAGHNRRKLEIRALRKQEAELARQLEISKRRVDAENEVNESDLKAVWEELARRQRLQCEQATQENELLRDVVGTHAKISQQIMLKTRRALANGLIPQQFVSPTFDWQSLSVEDHLAQVEKLFALAPRVFARPCFSSGRRSFQELQVNGDGEEGFVVTLNVAMVLPFSVDRVADALWLHTTRMSAHERLYVFKDLAADSSSLVSLFGGVSQCYRPEGCMHGQIATRRYKPTESSGVEFIVSKMVSDNKNVHGGPFAFYGDGFLKCTEVHRGVPSSLGDGVTTSPLTQVHWHRVVHAKSNSPKTRPVPHLSSDSIVKRMMQNVVWNLQAVENSLMQP